MSFTSQIVTAIRAMVHSPRQPRRFQAAAPNKAARFPHSRLQNQRSARKMQQLRYRQLLSPQMKVPRLSRLQDYTMTDKDRAVRQTRLPRRLDGQRNLLQKQGQARLRMARPQPQPQRRLTRQHRKQFWCGTFPIEPCPSLLISRYKQ